LSTIRLAWHDSEVRRRRLNRGTSRPALQAHSLVAVGVFVSDFLILAGVLHFFVTATSVVALRLGFQDRLAYTALGLLAAAAVGARRGRFGILRIVQPGPATARAALPLMAGVGSIGITLAVGGSSLALIAAAAVIAFVSGLALISASRAFWAKVIRYGIRTGGLRYRVAIVGGESGTVLRQIAAQSSPFVETVNVFDGPGPRAEDPSGSLSDLLVQTRTERVDAIIMAYAPADGERLQQAFTMLRCSVADIFLTSGLTRCGALPMGHPLASMPLLPLQRRAMTDIDNALKGVMDRLAGATLLLLLSPLLALTALAIKLDSPGPVLFKQPRIGYNNAVFMMFKFRSMYDHATDRTARQQTRPNDPRVTRVGRFIRRYSIDELPQLLNVILGEMSVVGPRPHAPGTNVEGLLLEHVAAGYPLRHRVLPGITGWAQINGSRGMLSSREQIRQRVSLDLEYIDRWSLLLDLKIIWLTAVREIWSRSAY
jgi:exopolysaccharide biosynthesis polyprenyl glycosylphosphotransferase